MLPNLLETVNFTFTEEILNGKLHFLWSVGWRLERHPAIKFCQICIHKLAKKKKFLDRTAKTGIEKRDYKVKILYTIGIILCEVLVRQVGLLRGSSGERKLTFRLFKIVTQSAITCSKLTIETLEEGVKYAQS